jgi:hypothetical protein
MPKLVRAVSGFRNRERLLDEVRRTGFLPRASSAAVPNRNGMPVRWTAIILLILLWNARSLLEGFVPWNPPKAPGPFVLLALALVFVTAQAVERSGAAQSWVLKPGRTVGEIRASGVAPSNQRLHASGLHGPRAIWFAYRLKPPPSSSAPAAEGSVFPGREAGGERRPARSDRLRRCLR